MESYHSSSLNLRCPSKGNKVIEQINLGQPLGVLLEKIAEQVGIPREAIIIKKGFPPKAIDLADPSKTIQELGIRNKDTLIIEEDPNVVVIKQPVPAAVI